MVNLKLWGPIALLPKHLGTKKVLFPIFIISLLGDLAFSLV